MIIDARVHFLRRRAEWFVSQVVTVDLDGSLSVDRVHATLDPMFYKPLEKEIRTVFEERGYNVNHLDLFN